jgi:hypothetical protein
MTTGLVAQTDYETEDAPGRTTDSGRGFSELDFSPPDALYLQSNGLRRIFFLAGDRSAAATSPAHHGLASPCCTVAGSLRKCQPRPPHREQAAPHLR